MSTPGEITIQAERHQSGFWIAIPLLVGGAHTISAVLDTGSPVSAMSPGAEATLSGLGLLHPGSRPGRYILRDVTASGQLLPALDVAVLPRLDRIEVQGLLGLDFLTQFERIHFDTRSLQLVLEGRP